MINDIINKIRSGSSLNNNEQEFLDHVINRPTHKDYANLWLAGLI